MSVEIRAASSGMDVAAALTLWGKGRSSHAATADTPAAVERLLGTDPGALLLTIDGTEPVGALIAPFDGWRGNLYRLVVAEGRRREGIGHALVGGGEERLRQQGAFRVTALVAYKVSRARAFWTAVGYPPDPVIGRHVRSL